jgi:HSP20 family protein
MSKKDQNDGDDVAGAAGFAKIARGLSDLFTVLADFDKLPRHGRHEKDGRVMEYSFATRTLGEAAEDKRASREAPSARGQAQPRRAPKKSSLEVLEPVTDVFDEQDEIVLLFELPGVERKAVRCLLDGDILLLEAKTEDRLYRKETLIEEKLAAGSPRLNLRNGVLEVRLTKAN